MECPLPRMRTEFFSAPMPLQVPGRQGLFRTNVFGLPKNSWDGENFPPKRALQTPPRIIRKSLAPCDLLKYCECLPCSVRTENLLDTSKPVIATVVETEGNRTVLTLARIREDGVFQLCNRDGHQLTTDELRLVVETKEVSQVRQGETVCIRGERGLCAARVETILDEGANRHQDLYTLNLICPKDSGKPGLTMKRRVVYDIPATFVVHRMNPMKKPLKPGQTVVLTVCQTPNHSNNTTLTNSFDEDLSISIAEQPQSADARAHGRLPSSLAQPDNPAKVLERINLHGFLFPYSDETSNPNDYNDLFEQLAWASSSPKAVPVKADLFP